jgi:predicted metalloprotease with PDZ domain
MLLGPTPGTRACHRLLGAPRQIGLLALIGLLICFARQSPAQETPAPRDIAYPGLLTVAVDLTQAERKIFLVHESIPVKPGPLTLLYPKWIPGEHAPSGPLATATGAGVSGVKITAGGQHLAWRRDLDEPYALHLEVPAGQNDLELEFQFLSSPTTASFGQGLSATDKLVDLEWNQVLFYPAGYFARGISVQASVTLPPTWPFGSALEPSHSEAGKTTFKPVTLEMLVDAPLIAGINFKRIDLSSDGAPPVFLDIVADRAANLAITPEQISRYKSLTNEAYALFGARHYQHYDFLLTLSDFTDHFGLEHHQSSDDRTDADLYTDAEVYTSQADLLSHEYVHSWNGKFRRPAGLSTPNFNVPMRDDLLWVYEGLTEYWGEVLAARAGMWSAGQFQERLAYVADMLSHVPGREWQTLQDTADEAALLYYTPYAWDSWRRSTDFYEEGTLLWLDVDTSIRELSHGSRSLDDFAHLFYASHAGPLGPLPYTFNDVVAGLSAVQPNDWAKFLRTRLDTNLNAPLDGLKRGGWKLIYSDAPNDYLKAHEHRNKWLDLRASIGLLIDADKSQGMLTDVVWNSAAFGAGLTPTMKLIAVNGQAYSPDVLRDAIKAAKDGTQPIELLVQVVNTFKTVRVNYHDGLKYPHLERIEGSEDRVSEIAKPHT